MKSKIHPMKLLHTLALVLLLSSSALLTVCSAQSRTTLPSWQVDSLINATLNSKEWEHLSDYYRKAFLELGQRYRESQAELIEYDIKIAKLDSAWKAYATAVDASRNIAVASAAKYEGLYYKEYNRGRKQVGIDLHPVGFNPITKSFYTGIGISIRLLGVNLFPKFKE